MVSAVDVVLLVPDCHRHEDMDAEALRLPPFGTASLPPLPSSSPLALQQNQGRDLLGQPARHSWCAAFWGDDVRLPY